MTSRLPPLLFAPAPESLVARTTFSLRVDVAVFLFYNSCF